MLVELVVENFYSFRDEAAFSMVAATIPEHPETVTGNGGLSLSKVSSIFGANASGKSNLLKAFQLVREGLLLPKGKEATWLNKIQPFHLDAAYEKEDSLLEVSFYNQDILYRYGFYANQEAVVEEYLYIENGEPELCFHRTKDGVEGPWETADIQSNRLLFADILPNYPSIHTWFKNACVILNSQKPSFTISMAKLHLKKYKHNLMTLIQLADASIHDVEIREELDPETGELKDEFYVIKLKKQLNGHLEPIQEGFLFEDVESSGTVKLLAMAGPIIEAMSSGGLLLIDEMDQSLHTLMTRYVVELFRGDLNRFGAQLIFSTHDISNLRSELFRRDQVWFVEKKSSGNSTLTSLVEYRFDEKDRKNNFEFYRNYLNGKYGAVPFLPPADWWVDNDET